MSEMNFDDLLNDLEDMTIVKSDNNSDDVKKVEEVKVEEVKVEEVKVEEVSTDPVDLLLSEDEPVKGIVDEVEEDVVDDFKIESVDMKELEILREENRKLKEELNKVKSKVKKEVVRQDPAIEEATQYFKETEDYYRSYIRGHFEYNRAKKELGENWKNEVAALVEDGGISVKQANKAIRNIKEQLNENAEDAVTVTGIESMLMKDEDFLKELAQ